VSGSTFVGVDTGGTHTRVMWRDECVSFGTRSDYRAWVTALSERLTPLSPIERLVVALPTVVEGEKILAPPNLGSGWQAADISGDLRRLSNIGDVVLVQDTEAAGYGVLEREQPTVSPSLLITLSSGVGGALLSKLGVLPLEVGHMILNLAGGNTACRCGQIGCAEADLSGWAIEAQLKAGPEAGSPEHASPAFWVSYGKLLGRFFCVLAPLFSAKQIFLMGGVSNQAAQFLPTCSEWVDREMRRSPPPRISVVEDFDTIGAYGALALARRAGHHVATGQPE
jgi:predicted NBD/HSP70 family sugar kinase